MLDILDQAGHVGTELVFKDDDGISIPSMIDGKDVDLRS